MIDEERSRLIAEFEGLILSESKIGERPWVNELRRFGQRADYAHDLNATMRAARRLPEGILLNVNSAGSAVILKYALPIHSRYGEPEDLPRHAYLVLSDYLASREGK